jgi:hypothetical protein
MEYFALIVFIYVLIDVGYKRNWLSRINCKKEGKAFIVLYVCSNRNFCNHI